MSAQMRPDEFERVLRTMRDRLTSVSAEISELLTKVEWHSGTAPPSVRVSARTAAAEIGATQAWLVERMGQLPVDLNQRYALMQEMLQVQFVALQKVSGIVSDLISLRNKPVAPDYLPKAAQRAVVQQPLPSPVMPPLARPQAPMPFARDFGQPMGLPQHGPSGQGQPTPYPPQHAEDPAWGPLPSLFTQKAPAPGLAPVRLSDLTMEPDVRTRATTRSQKSTTSGRKATASKKSAREKPAKSPSSTGKLALVSGTLVGAILALGAGGYFAYDKFYAPKATAARSVPGKKERISIGDPSARESALGNVGVRAFEGPNRVPNAPPMAAPPLTDETGVRSGPQQFPGLTVVEPVPRGGPRAPDQGFVAVIATHRDKQALEAIYNDLRRQHPGVLGTHKAEGQAVNLGDKGVWHQLILMPPGPREQADGLCAQLRASGYSRCMVRPYR